MVWPNSRAGKYTPTSWCYKGPQFDLVVQRDFRCCRREYERRGGKTRTLENCKGAGLNSRCAGTATRGKPFNRRHSERSEESLFLLCFRPGGIPHFVRNDGDFALSEPVQRAGFGHQRTNPSRFGIFTRGKDFASSVTSAGTIPSIESR